MPAFLYKLRDDTGRTLFGITEAKDINDVKRQFRNSDNYFVSADKYDLSRLARISLTLDELLMFTHRLSSLVEAGVPILLALHILWRQSESKNIQIIVSYIRQSIEDGANLLDAFSAFPNVFSKMYLALIGVAEVGAGLVEVLRKLSQNLQEQKKFIVRIKRATMYPIIVLSFAFLVLMGMFMFVVPTFQKVLVNLNAKLPLLTQILFNISNILRNVNFLIITGAVVVLGILFYKIMRPTKTFSYFIDSLKLRLPFVKKIFYPLSVARFSRSLSLLIGGGVRLVSAIDVAKTTVVNVRVENAISDIRKQVTEGGSLYEAFKSTKAFPIILVEMVGIGENSGKLPQVLEKVANHLDEEVDYLLYKFLTMLEPLLIVLLGGIILIVFLGTYLPIFSLQGALRAL